MGIKIFILLLLSIIFINTSALAQEIATKSNLLYDAGITFNAGVELKLNMRRTFDFSVNYNPWTFSGNKKMKHILVQPELRFWTNESFFGHYLGVHAHYGYYNVGGLGPFTALKNNRYEGWLAGGGFSYGYQWSLSDRWSLEASLGLGYAFMDYAKYDCRKCGEKQSDGVKHYVGPTKIGVSIIYFLKDKKKRHKIDQRILSYDGGNRNELMTQQPLVVNEPMSEADKPVPVITPVEPPKKTAEKRTKSNQAYIIFSSGQSVIIPELSGNYAELEKITRNLDYIKNEGPAQITRIQVSAHTSPEGPMISNRYLSRRRAEALVNWLKKFPGLQEVHIDFWGEGEDWVRLLELIKSDRNLSDADKQHLIHIIGSVNDPDAREKRIMSYKGGEVYRYLFDYVYPELRRCDYRIEYTDYN